MPSLLYYESISWTFLSCHWDNHFRFLISCFFNSLCVHRISRTEFELLSNELLERDNFILWPTPDLRPSILRATGITIQICPQSLMCLLCFTGLVSFSSVPHDCSPPTPMLNLWSQKVTGWGHWSAGQKVSLRSYQGYFFT